MRNSKHKTTLMWFWIAAHNGCDSSLEESESGWTSEWNVNFEWAALSLTYTHTYTQWCTNFRAEGKYHLRKLLYNQTHSLILPRRFYNLSTLHCFLQLANWYGENMVKCVDKQNEKETHKWNDSVREIERKWFKGKIDGRKENNIFFFCLFFSSLSRFTWTI